MLKTLLFPVSSAFLFALTFFFRKKAGATLSLQSAYLIEAFIQAFIVILIFIAFSPEIKKGLDFKTDGIKYAAIAGITVVAAVFCNYLALKTGSFSKVIAITSPSQIIFGAALGVLLAGDSLSLKQIIGTVLGIVGIFLVVG